MGMRSFDPSRLGGDEATAWVAYYRRQWGTFLRAAIGMVREGFGMPWPKAIYGAWLVLRANQLWAPVTNDPDGARRCMRRFYQLVAGTHDESFDVDEAARLELEWWRAHRELSGAADLSELVQALAALYAHIYGVLETDVLDAATGRAEAMRISDQWVTDGCDPTSPAIEQERAELVRGYTALQKAVAH
jgi:hypothetical protein